MPKGYRIVVRRADGGGWYAAKIAGPAHAERVHERGPLRESEQDADQDADNYRRFGAWLKS